MKVVVKIGGTLLEDAPERLRIAASVARQVRAGHRILLVHGGGKQLSRYLERSGIESRFVDGLRVTTADALDGVVKVLAGTVNHELLAAFHQVGIPAVGISGIDAGCLMAEKLPGKNGEDWGFVGKIIHANPSLWEHLLAGDFLPVMACLAVGENGQIYNINADLAAVACAIHLRAERLIFMTDVDGVRDQAGRTIRAMASDEIPGLLQSGTVTGGMLAKLNAIQEALAGGISGVHICNGHVDGALDAGILQSDGGSRHPGSEEEFNQASGTMVFSSTPSRDEEAVDARSLNRIG